MPQPNHARNLAFQSHTGCARHSLPKRRKRKSDIASGALLDEQAFVDVGPKDAAHLATKAVESFLQTIDNRIRTLSAAKGGPLSPLESIFAVKSPWIYGHLGLVVDEAYGRVWRSNCGKSVCFDPESLAWDVFLAAWDGGASGCPQELWDCRDDLLHDPVREKAIRRDVNRKLRPLGIRLERKRPPRLVECPTFTK